MISLNFPGLWLQWGKKEGINPSDLVVPILGHLWLGIQRMEVWSSWPHYQPLALGGSVCTVLERCCGKTSFHLHTLPKRLLPRLPFQPERVEGIMFSTCIKLCLLIPPVSPLCSLNSSVYEFFLAMRQGINKRWKTIKHLSNFPWQCCIKRRPCSSLPPLAECSLFPPPLPTTMFPFRQQFHLHEPATLFHTVWALTTGSLHVSSRDKYSPLCSATSTPLTLPISCHFKQSPPFLGVYSPQCTQTVTYHCLVDIFCSFNLSS